MLDFVGVYNGLEITVTLEVEVDHLLNGFGPVKTALFLVKAYFINTSMGLYFRISWSA